MAVTLNFRGILLFCQRGEEIAEVRAPICSGVPAEGYTGNPNHEHLDHSVARPHYAGVFYPDDPTGQQHYHLDDRSRVTIGDPSAPKCRGNLHRLAPLDGYTWRRDDSYPHAAISLHGPPRARTSYGGLRNFDFPGHAAVHDRVHVAFPDSVEVAISGSNPASFRVENGNLYVYNFDEFNPSEEQLNRPDEDDSNDIVDDDFKWLYSLVKPRDGRTRAEATGGILPAPVVVPRDPKLLWALGTISVSTCFSAVLDE